MDAKYYNGPEDTREFSERVYPRDEDDGGMVCPYCEARSWEAHQPACPLYLPLCACGNVATRHVDGVPVCARCRPRVTSEAA